VRFVMLKRGLPESVGAHPTCASQLGRPQCFFVVFFAAPYRQAAKRGLDFGHLPVKGREAKNRGAEGEKLAEEGARETRLQGKRGEWGSTGDIVGGNPAGALWGMAKSPPKAQRWAVGRHSPPISWRSWIAALDRTGTGCGSDESVGCRIGKPADRQWLIGRGRARVPWECGREGGRRQGNGNAEQNGGGPKEAGGREGKKSGKVEGVKGKNV